VTWCINCHPICLACLSGDINLEHALAHEQGGYLV
jgi:hypothetical protein